MSSWQGERGRRPPPRWPRAVTAGRLESPERGGIAFSHELSLAGRVVLAVERHVRHVARAHAGTREALRRAGAARAAAAARGPPPHGAGLGNRAATRARRLGVARCAAGPEVARGDR